MRLRSLFVSILALVMAGPSAAQSRLSPEDQALRQRYAIPASRFVEIEGTPIHYADEGKGPAIVLIHGSFSSLRQWNGWARTLIRRYRVVRLDLPPAGLSGPAPDGVYSTDRNVRVIDALVHRLGIARFTLVSTSSGSITGAAYAAAHPEQLTGFVFSNDTIGPVTFDPATFTPALKAALAEDALHKDFHKPEYWRQIMLLNVVDQRVVTPELVQEWTDLNNRALRMPPATSPRITGARTAADFLRITTPTLLLWSSDDHEAPVATEGPKALAALAATDKTLVVIPRCGHMLAMDCGARGLALAMPFFDRISKPER